MFSSDEGFVKKQLLGEILLEENKLDVKRLKEALSLQKEQDKPIGEVLVGMGLVDDHDIMLALIKQCRLPYIAIDEYPIDADVKDLIPKETAQKSQSVPLSRVGNILSMVMANPLDAEMKEEFRRVTKCEIAAFISTKEQIDRAISRCYEKEA